MLFDGRLVETVKHTHKGTSKATMAVGTWSQQRHFWRKEKRREPMPYSIDVNKKERAYRLISNAKVMCAKSTVVDNGQSIRCFIYTQISYMLCRLLLKACIR